MIISIILTDKKVSSIRPSCSVENGAEVASGMALLDVGQGQDPVGGGQGSVVAPEKQYEVS